MLLDDPDTGDLRAKVTQAWRDFARALAEVLPGLPAGVHLDLRLDPTASGTDDASYSVAVTVAEDGQLVARAVSNSSLPEPYRMNRAAVADMVALGWSPPGVDPGSGEQFGLTVPPDDVPRLATVLARTLRDIYGAPHPAFLVYLAHNGGDEPLPVTPLGAARAASQLPPHPPEKLPADEPEQHELHDAAALRDQVRMVIAAMLRTTPERLMADDDGDIGIRAGTAMVFVKVREDPPLVDVFSPVLTQIKPTEKLYGKLSELTNRMPVGRLFCANDTVWASIPVFGRNFQPSHLTLAVQVMTGLADELDERLQGEFGGRLFFSSDDRPSHHQESPDDEDPASTGMYL